jgi:hypothetical protein
MQTAVATRQDLQLLKADLLRELGGRLDRLEQTLTERDRRLETHEVRLAVVERVVTTTGGSWKLMAGLVAVMTLVAQALVRVAEAAVAAWRGAP